MRAFVLIFALKLTAVAADTRYAQQLMRSRSASAILSAQTAFEMRLTLRLACEQELKQVRAPISCFELLRLDELEGRSTRSTTERLRVRLIQRCQHAADTLAISPKRLLPPSVPAPCRQSLIRAQKILAYKGGDRWPEY